MRHSGVRVNGVNQIKHVEKAGVETFIATAISTFEIEDT